MKKFVRLLTALGLTLALVGCGAALAAEENVIKVQLDGRELTFTDAVPQARDGRTFLPFRAVFEALGAQVSWDADTGAVSAQRDGRTVTMLPGSTDVSVEDGGVTTSIQMDVAPYAANENGAWRTYVPVRFAAQAFDCAVGWDQAAYTVLLVDSGKLLTSAMEGKNYTYLDKLLAYSEKYNEGIWNADFTLDGSMTMLGAAMPLNAKADMIMEGGTKVEMDMNMKLDMTQLAALMSAMTGTGLEAEDQAMFELMKNEGFGIAARGDLADGKLYMNMMNGKLFEEAFTGELSAEEKAQMPVGMKDLWFSMDMAALFGQSGMNWTELMKAAQSAAGKDYARQFAQMFLAGVTLNAASNEGYGVSYQVYKDSAESLALAFSDEGFTKEGDTYTAFVDGGLQKMELSLTMDKEAVTGYGMVMNSQVEQDGMVMGMIIDMAEAGDKMTAGITMDAAGLFSAELTMEGGYVPGETAPATQPPQGATVVDLNQLMNGSGAGIPGLPAGE